MHELLNREKNSMKILVVIPARSGSKRLPKKNLRMLGNKTLIEWTLDIAVQIPNIADIMVSTDDKIIAEISLNAGALVPWLRPNELAQDDSSLVEVVLHALDWYETARSPVEAVLLLQPTSPFRSLDLVQKGIAMFTESEMLPVIGVSKVFQHPELMMRQVGEYLQPLMDLGKRKERSQDLHELFVPNGNFYLISAQNLRDSKSFFQPVVIPLLASSEKESLDIDTPEDLEIAELMIRMLK